MEMDGIRSITSPSLLLLHLLPDSVSPETDYLLIFAAAQFVETTYKDMQDVTYAPTHFLENTGVNMKIISIAAMTHYSNVCPNELRMLAYKV